MATFIAAFLLTLPLIFMVGNDDVASLPQTMWLQVAVPLLLIARYLTQEGSEPFRAPHALRPAIAFLGWSALSVLWAADPFAAESVIFRWLAAAGLAFLIANTVESAVDARRLLMALFWASVVVSGLGLLQHLGGWTGIPQAYPPAGTLANKNVAAGFVAVMAPLGVAAFTAATTGVSVIALSMGMALAFVFQTGCRAAMLALIVQAAVALFLIPLRDVPSRWPRAKWRALAAGAVAFVWLASMTPSASSRDQGRTSELLFGTARPLLRFLTGAPVEWESESPEGLSPLGRAERSVNIRLGVWGNTLEMIRSNPVAGVGIGNFAVNYPRFASEAPDGTRVDERVDSAHNDYVELVAEVGWLGAGLFGWFVLATMRTMAASNRCGRDEGLGLVSGLGLLGLLVLAAVSPTVSQPVFLVTAATFVGVGLRPHAQEQVEAPAANGLSNGKAPFGYTLGLVGASASLVVASFWGVAQIRADRHVLTMAYAEAREDWPAVVEEGLSARRLSPGRIDPRFGTASALLRLGRTREAAQQLEELTAVDPYNANAIGNLGIAYATLGDGERARACFERVLSLRPDDPFARAGLRRILAPIASSESR